MIDPIKLSRDLAEIVLLTDDLRGQAVNDAGAHVDGTSLPGGRAMIALAPVADQATWERQVEAIERAWAATVATADVDGWPAGMSPDDRPDIASDEDDTTEPALQLLRFWSDHYRRITQQDWLHIKTLATEANYLRTNLEWILNREPHADVFARDVRTARTSLENILSAGKRAERSRVVCDACLEPPQLIRIYAPRVKLGYRCQCGAELALDETDSPAPCPNPCTAWLPPEPIWWSDEEKDRWKCPGCKKKFDADAFARAHARHLNQEGAARFVAQGDAIDTLVAQGRSKRTVRSWLDCPLRRVDRCTECKRTWPGEEQHTVCPGKVKDGDVFVDCGGELEETWKGDRDDIVEGYCEIKTRRVYVWWPDLWRRHLTRQTRRSNRGVA